MQQKNKTRSRLKSHQKKETYNHNNEHGVSSSDDGNDDDSMTMTTSINPKKWRQKCYSYTFPHWLVACSFVRHFVCRFWSKHQHKTEMEIYDYKNETRTNCISHWLNDKYKCDAQRCEIILSDERRMTQIKLISRIHWERMKRWHMNLIKCREKDLCSIILFASRASYQFLWNEIKMWHGRRRCAESNFHKRINRQMNWLSDRLNQTGTGEPVSSTSGLVAVCVCVTNTNIIYPTHRHNGMTFCVETDSEQDEYDCMIWS